MTDTPHDGLPRDPAGGGPVEMHSPHHAAHAHHGHKAHHPRVSGKSRRRLVGGLLVLLALGGLVAAAGVLTGFLPNPVVAGDPKASGRGEPRASGPQPVKVVRPKRDPNFRITLRRVAAIEPYYQAGLRARVTGEVRAVTKDIGEPVRAGEVLVEIDAPDLRQAVEQKAAVVVQREKELLAAKGDLGVAKAAGDAAAVAVKAKGVDVRRAENMRDARKTELDAVTVLYNRGSVDKVRVEAALLDYQAGERGVEAALLDVEKAKVDEAGKAASYERAQADVELKEALVEVARKDRAAAAIQLGYTRLYAPFDGVITARTTDPGKFVSAGSGGSTEPLVTVTRTDLVTVVAKVPDAAAPFVSWDTEATVEFTLLPGVTVRGPITRYSRVIDPADQTMRVEVDVYNGTRAEYQEMMTRAAVKTTVSPQLPLSGLAGVAAAGAGLIRSKADHKGWHEGWALTPTAAPGGKYRPIVPGTAATMQLDLENFGESFLLPSKAVYGKAGQYFVLAVEDGKTRAVPVAVQMNDGSLVKVAVLASAGNGRQATRELTGDEVIVATRQLEVGEGAAVTPVLEAW